MLHRLCSAVNKRLWYLEEVKISYKLIFFPEIN